MIFFIKSAPEILNSNVIVAGPILCAYCFVLTKAPNYAVIVCGIGGFKFKIDSSLRGTEPAKSRD